MVSRMKILVIGSNSFSGQDFIDLCLTDGHQVLGMSRSKEKPDVFLRYSGNPNKKNFDFVRADYTKDVSFMVSACKAMGFDWIVNFACQSEVAPSWETPWDWFHTNVTCLSRFVKGLMDAGAKVGKFIHISSPEIYGTCESNTWYFDYDPSTPYAVSRAAGDMFLHCCERQYGFPVSFVRSTNVYGSRQQLFKLIPRTVLRILDGGKIQLHGGGRAIKSFIHIRDISRGELAICYKTTPGRVWHLSPDFGMSVRSIVEKVAVILGKTLDDVAESVEERPGQDAAYELSSIPARKELMWLPTIPLNEGLHEVVDWVKENYFVLKDISHDYQHKGSFI